MAEASRVLLAQGSMKQWFAKAPASWDWLGPAERRRVERITADTRRKQFVAGRWMMRQVLCAWNPGTTARDWLLTAADNAPPQVLGGPETLHLSISHSGDRLACAVSGHAVGIDVEALPPSRARDIDGLLDMVCTAAERAALTGLAPSKRTARFHGLWTLKEAWLKARGEPMTPGRLRELQTRPAAPADEWILRGVVSSQQALALYGTRSASLSEPLGGGASAFASSASHWAVDDLAGRFS